MTKHCKNSETSYESIRSYAFGFHERVLREKWSENKGFCRDWIDMQNNLTGLWHSLAMSVDKEDLLSQVTYHRFPELLRSLRWHMTAVFSGAYESAIRDLRFVFEDMCQAVYLDQSFGHLEPEERYEKIRGEDRLRGRKLICKLDLPQNVKDHFKKLYNELCDYVHPSFKLLMELFEDFKISFFYNEEWFLNAQSFHQRTCDAVLYLMLRTFPEAAPIFFSRLYVISSLRKMDCLLTLSLRQEPHQ